MTFSKETITEAIDQFYKSPYGLKESDYPQEALTKCLLLLVERIEGEKEWAEYLRTSVFNNAHDAVAEAIAEQFAA